MTIDTLLLFDVETGGLDPDVHPLLEVGAVLWSVKHKSVLRCFSSLVKASSNDAIAINRIPIEQLADAPDGLAVREHLKRLLLQSDAAVAHNASFDVQWLPEIPKHKPVICSCHHIEWPMPGMSSPIDTPRSRPGKSLVALCLEHGVGVGSAHRALTDALLLARLFERVAETHDMQPMLARAMRPRVRVVADLPRSQNETLKAHAFRWDPERSQWWREMIQEDVAALPFAMNVRECA